MKKGFTLSEVLIALTIIGVIAAITIPSLMQSTEEQEYVSKLKKAHSILTQVYARTAAAEVYPEEWGFLYGDSREMINKILPYVNYTKVCYGAAEQCHKGALKYKNKNAFKTSSTNTIFGGAASRSAVILSDGMIIGSYVQSADCSVNISNLYEYKNLCGEYMVDVNGEKGPNMYGKDIFIFVLTQKGIFPTGFESTTVGDSWPYDFENGCLASTAKGGGCTGWVLKNSNLDYLHCPSKIRQGKTSCK